MPTPLRIKRARALYHFTARGEVQQDIYNDDAVPDLPRRWLGYALDVYGEVRFGGARPTDQRAANMRKAVHGASEILAGLMPELRRA